MIPYVLFLLPTVTVMYLLGYAGVVFFAVSLLFGMIWMGHTISGSPAAEEQAEVTASAEDTSAMQLYKKNCMSCHGNDLSGRVGQLTRTENLFPQPM
ncbi:hypothetical protein [Brevibacillus parabrevis]|uniref:hypothetical protein n=1 Tax=Brevibacillus parabrevis TaxID=54914 RepID=UPI0028D1E003|nr:hypothetical protein [Brevibacillus parabrevis]